MAEHFISGPSSADIWTRCKGYVQMCRAVGPKPSNQQALEGTAGHAFSQYACEQGHYDVRRFIGEYHEETGITLDAELADACNVFTGRVKALVAMCEALGATVEFGSECRVDLSHIYPGFFGTRDWYAIAVFSNWAMVIDLKLGRIEVGVVDNRQLVNYSLDILHKYPNVEYIRMEIVQSRGMNGGEPVRAVDYTRAQIEAYIPLIQEMQAANHSDVIQDCTPGDHCTYCPGNGSCRPHFEYVIQLMEPKKYNPHLLTMPEIEAVLANEKQIKRFLEGAYIRGRQLALSGTPMTRMKLVTVESKEQQNRDITPEQVAERIRLVTGKMPDMDKIAPRRVGALSEIRKVYGEAAAKMLTVPKTKSLELRPMDAAGTAEQSPIMLALSQPIIPLEK